MIYFKIKINNKIPSEIEIIPIVCSSRSLFFQSEYIPKESIKIVIKQMRISAVVSEFINYNLKILKFCFTTAVVLESYYYNILY